MYGPTVHKYMNPCVPRMYVHTRTCMRTTTATFFWLKSSGGGAVRPPPEPASTTPSPPFAGRVLPARRHERPKSSRLRPCGHADGGAHPLLSALDFVTRLLVGDRGGRPKTIGARKGIRGCHRRCRVSDPSKRRGMDGRCHLATCRRTESTSHHHPALSLQCGRWRCLAGLRF